jgi:glycosyltransferase involved in cell wall biosynthesis
MNTGFKVSVIIPVYNAAKYIARAIHSAIEINEVGEILLIDDGSTDDSLNICKRLAIEDHKIKVLTHADLGNKGPSASRNLGIIHASFEYIAFLDSDDYYLPHRFHCDREVFERYGDADAVYGCNSELFENQRAKELFMTKRSNEITTITEYVDPGQLYKCHLFGGFGEFHISTITIKRKALLKTGLFNTGLRYGEDTELWLKLAVKCRLYPGEIQQPISVRCVHEFNSIHDWDLIDRQNEIMYQSIFDWILKQDVPFGVKNDFFSALYIQSSRKQASVFSIMMKQVYREPSVLLQTFFYRKVYLQLVS